MADSAARFAVDDPLPPSAHADSSSPQQSEGGVRIHRIGIAAAPRGRRARPMNALDVQIAAVLAKTQGRPPPLPGGRLDPNLAQRHRRVARIYRDLTLAGYPLTDVHQLHTRHAVALLRFWQANGRPVNTIRSEWAFLRSWLASLGMPDMVAPLSHYVPPLYQRRTPAPLARHSDERLLQRLASGGDQAHALVERLCYCARLTAQEALTLDPHTVGSTQASTAAQKMVTALAEPCGRAASTLADLKAYLRLVGRPTLLWKGMTVAQGVRRHYNRLTYLRKLVAEAGDADAARP